MREAYLEASCCAYARKRGCHAIKLAYGVTGIPDRLFLLPGGRFWLVEFKVPGATLSPRQRLVHGQLAAIGHDVAVISSTQHFRDAIDLLLR